MVFKVLHIFLLHPTPEKRNFLFGADVRWHCDDIHWNVDNVCCSTYLSSEEWPSMIAGTLQWNKLINRDVGANERVTASVGVGFALTQSWETNRSAFCHVILTSFGKATPTATMTSATQNQSINHILSRLVCHFIVPRASLNALPNTKNFQSSQTDYGAQAQAHTKHNTRKPPAECIAFRIIWCSCFAVKTDICRITCSSSSSSRDGPLSHRTNWPNAIVHFRKSEFLANKPICGDFCVWQLALSAIKLTLYSGMGSEVTYPKCAAHILVAGSRCWVYQFDWLLFSGQNFNKSTDKVSTQIPAHDAWTIVQCTWTCAIVHYYYY